MTQISIGFETYDGHGPGIFLTRLKTELEKTGRFDAENPDVWILLSFRDLPEAIHKRKAAGLTKVIVRMDGAYCNRHHKVIKPFGFSVPVIDNWYSAKKNAKQNTKIVENLTLADDIIFQSLFCYQLTQRFVTQTRRGPIIFNGVDLNQFSPEGELHPDINPDHFNLLSSHGFKPYHRLHDSFRILSAFLKTKPNAFLNILGSGDEATFAYARQVADDLRLKEGEHYRFLGKYPAEALPQIYRACDVMLNLSYWDSCPNVAIEAMACGLPVVGTAYGGLAELIQGNNNPTPEGDSPGGGLTVAEKIPFTYLDHHDFKRMPKAPIADYAQALQELSNNLLFYQLKARARAEAHFDITHTAKQYLMVAEGVAPKQATFV